MEMVTIEVRLPKEIYDKASEILARQGLTMEDALILFFQETARLGRIPFEYAKDGSPYLAIFCHVRKKDVPKFLAALEDLKKSMILCGHPHYEDEISSIMDKMEKMKGAQHGDENDAAQETEQKRTA